MPTKKTVTHTHATEAQATEESTMHAAELDQATTSAADRNATGNPAFPAPLPSAAPLSATPPLFLNSPPPDANIPAVPKGFVPQSGTTYRAVVPKKAELVALAMAVSDLKKLTNYAQMFGATAPPYEELVQTFEVANEWSTMRTASTAWDVYCRDQEGISWGVMRRAMASFKGAFDLVVQRDASLAAKLPGVAALLGAKQMIAAKGVATRRANKKALAEGKAPIHGAVGKKRKKQASKEILAARPVPETVPPGATSAAGGE